MEDVKLYLLNVSAFTVTMMDWLEPILKIILLIVTIGYTLQKWYKLKNKFLNEKYKRDYNTLFCY